MAKEQKRGCGYRKVGGLYLVGEGIAIGCDRLPFNLDVCPTCNQGIKFSMGFTWVDASKLLGRCQKFESNFEGEMNYSECHRLGCKICNPLTNQKVGLMWVGKKFYTPEKFIDEARNMGVSKRIPHVPKDLKIGDFVMLAHKEAGKQKLENGTFVTVPAIFYGFHVTRIEKIITESEAKDVEKLKEYEKRNITPVVVPDNDADHQGTVYDKETEEQPKQTLEAFQ